MKVLALIFAIVALTSSFKIGAKKAHLITEAKNNHQCGPDETTCPNGCCPEADWYCCLVHDLYCAPTPGDCPFLPPRVPLVNMAKSRQCGPDETLCPSGCCPEGPDWYCCPDAFWPGCAATADDCPYVAKRVPLVKMVKNNQ